VRHFGDEDARKQLSCVLLRKYKHGRWQDRVEYDDETYTIESTTFSHVEELCPQIFGGGFRNPFDDYSRGGKFSCGGKWWM
jgi:hypothetical protein